MSRVALGVVLGIVFGVVDALLMLPLSFPDKRAALLGAFCARFALGFFAATVRLPWPAVVTGIVVGILTSLPDAIVTKAYLPILVTGVLFGAFAGWIVGRWGAAARTDQVATDRSQERETTAASGSAPCARRPRSAPRRSPRRDRRPGPRARR